MAYYNYVKFQRGTKNAYEHLANKDENTLYFIYPDQNSSTGSLYLGSKLISGGDTNVIAASLSDLTDVLLDGATEGSVLVRDNNGQWVARSLEELSELISTKELSVNENIFTFDNNTLDLIGFTAAPAGSVLAKTASGSINWIEPAGSGSGTEVDPAVIQNLQDQIDNLAAAQENFPTSADIIEAIRSAGHLTYRRVSSILGINVNNDDNLNTIFLVPENNSQSGLNNYREYLIVVDANGNRNFELIGTTGEVTLDNYVTKDEFNTAVGNLSELLGDPENNIPSVLDRVELLETAVGDITQLYDYSQNPNTTIVNEINTLAESLIWKEINEE